MSNPEQKKQEQPKEKILLNAEEQPTEQHLEPLEIKVGSPIRVTYNGTPYNLNEGDLDINVDDASDRQYVEAVARYIEKQTGVKVLMRDHQKTKLENGYVLISPPAVYG